MKQRDKHNAKYLCWFNSTLDAESKMPRQKFDVMMRFFRNFFHDVLLKRLWHVCGVITLAVQGD